jgi:flagellum-specific peptidoglycan hydrolase FlgJ
LILDLKKTLYPAAQEIGRQYGILPAFIAAVASLETGFGSSQLCNQANNLFSIKGSYKGSSISLPTSEYLNHKWIRTEAQFRKYPSVKESIIDFCELMKNGVSWDHTIYSRAVIGVTDLEKCCYLFGRTPYMTDPAYTGKLLACIKSGNLQTLDQTPQQPKEKTTHYAVPSGGWNPNSIVDYLKSQGRDSSFPALTILAHEHGIKNYTGTAAQNRQLLADLKGGK